MVTRTPSQQAKANGEKGKRAERAVAAAFRDADLVKAKRAVRTGTRAGDRIDADPGDLADVPRTVVSVKDATSATNPSDREFRSAWITELDAMTAGAGAAYALLVVKRRGYADAGRWWTWLTWAHLDALLGNEGHHPGINRGGLVRVELADVLPLLRAAVEDDLDAEPAEGAA